MHKILERSNGFSDIEFKNNSIRKLFQNGCSRVLFPNNYNTNHEIVLINTAGGITCNDKIKTNITATSSDISVSTQAAEKIYAGIGEPANIEINITLKNSTLYWLPKELILFDKSKLDRKININLTNNSNLIFCETTIFGRKAMSEKINNISLVDNWKIYINSSLKHFEAININESINEIYKNNYTFSNKSTLSTVLIFGEIINQIEDELKKTVKNIKNNYVEMTKFYDKIIIRCIAEDNYDLKKTLNFIMNKIIYDKLPRSWDL